MNRAVRRVLAGLVVLTAGWLVAPRAAQPLYDGIGFPDQPYRFVQRPAGAPVTKPASAAQASASVSVGSVGDLNAVSAEVGPQVSVQIPAGSLSLPVSAASVTLQAAPVSPLPAPAGQYLWSNVYQVSISPAAQLRAGQAQASITLRAATGQRPIPHIAVYQDGRWTPLATLPVGNDIYDAQLTQFGRYAVLGTVPLNLSLLRTAGGGSRGWSVGAVIGLAVIATIVVAFLLVRRRRGQGGARRNRTPEIETEGS